MIDLKHGVARYVGKVDAGYVRRRMGRWVSDAHRRRPVIVPVVIQS